MKAILLTAVALACGSIGVNAQMTTASGPSSTFSNAIPGATPLIALTPIVGGLPEASNTSLLVTSNVLVGPSGLPMTGQVQKSVIAVPGGAQAFFGRHQVNFPADIAEPIQIVTPSGERLSCRATFLALYDTQSGQSYMLGQVTNRIGSIIVLTTSS